MLSARLWPLLSLYERLATPWASSTLPRTLIQRCGTPTVPNVCGLPLQTTMLGPAAQAAVVNVRSPESDALPAASVERTR